MIAALSYRQYRTVEFVLISVFIGFPIIGFLTLLYAFHCSVMGWDKAFWNCLLISIALWVPAAAAPKALSRLEYTGAR